MPLQCRAAETASSIERYKHRAEIPQVAAVPLALTSTDLLGKDSGFEAGTPNPYWTEASINFGSPLCTVATCGSGGGTGPHTGSWWAWFGGIVTG